MSPCEFIKNMLSVSYSTTQVLVVWDFNFPKIAWTTMISKKLNHHSQMLVDTIQDLHLYQHITEPTWYRHGQMTNLLDLCLTNFENMVHRINYRSGLGLSDHLCISWDMKIETQTDIIKNPSFVITKETMKG